VPDLPTVKSRLPNNLNPNLFAKEANTYCDDYKKRYSVDWGRWGFVIENNLPFRIFLCAGFNGKEVEDRWEILDLLRIAQQLHDDTGKWPALDDEWEEMCPGGLMKLDVTGLAATSTSSPTLPDVLGVVSGKLDRILSVRNLPFAEAEHYYRDSLRGLTAFSEAIRLIQRDFDEHPVCVLNTNTKTRRLRFVEVLARFVAAGLDSKKLLSSTLAWAHEHAGALQAYEDTKGAILLATGTRSVIPYLDLAKEIGILTTVGRGIALSNSGRALILLDESKSSFLLSIEERAYFLFDLLAYDRDILWPLLVFLREKKVRKREVRREFPSRYKSHLERLRGFCGTGRARRQVDDTILRLEGWRRPDVYMEHVVDPRLSWLIDLQLCRFEADSVSLTEGGDRLAAILEGWSDDANLPLTKEYLRWQYFKQIAPCLTESVSAGRRKKLPRNEVTTLLNGFCENVLKETKSLAPNRIVASTLFRFAGVRAFIDHMVALDFRDLIRFFTDEECAKNVQWQLRWQPAQDDGYLTRMNSTQVPN
jgi:hypothetical protein